MLKVEVAYRTDKNAIKGYELIVRALPVGSGNQNRSYDDKATLLQSPSKVFITKHIYCQGLFDPTAPSWELFF